MANKLCKNCIHHTHSEDENGGAYDTCWRNSRPRKSLVTGKLIGWVGYDCEAMRQDRKDDDWCGSQAKYFEPTLWAKFKSWFMWNRRIQEAE